MRSHTFTASELNNIVLNNIKVADPQNLVGTFSSIGTKEIRFATKNGGTHRWFEGTDGKSSISGRYENVCYNYAKMTTTQKKVFYAWLCGLDFEMCTTDTDYSFFQEVGADKVTFDMDNDGEPMNIVKRVPVKLI